MRLGYVGGYEGIPEVVAFSNRIGPMLARTGGISGRNLISVIEDLTEA